MGMGHAEMTSPYLAVPGAMIGLGLRKRRASEDVSPVLYDASQVLVAALLVAAVASIVAAVASGLETAPEMFIAGNDSTASRLVWFEDRASETLAQPWLLSVPLWAYRGAVALWAVWVLVAGIGWSSWAWGCLKQHGLWRPLTKPLNLPPTVP